MIGYENHLGVIDISHDYFVSLVGETAMSCFGVAGMAETKSQKGILGMFHKKDLPDRGVRVRTKNGALNIDLHIIVLYGTNINAIVKSIVNKVSYQVEDITGLPVSRVNVYVDGMNGE
ncbi:Asp23/Gls24 family envelope stress response protein [Massiliimalia massiliensis]|jgi:uncharacterized alkaline shock family protein YloU|uniref:Asp23/Gls24 family envelope stress response protein n=1 Tax=Massiliimalia massiliensis TaxID=1852384 RepID=UPI0009844562|nr:Asp23/Gls24 family envelope stress response protein [Massiliimalia massiliensis]